MYVIYRNFEKVGEGKSLEEVASMLGGTKQSISKRKKADCFYKWKCYLIFNPQRQGARAYFAFIRLAWLFNNPATNYITGIEIINTVENIKAKILD